MIEHNKARRLCVLQGHPDPVFYHKLIQTTEALLGDWIVISYQSHLPNTLSPTQAKQLLGQEFKHAIFDATEGLNLEALAILAGTLVAGSLLILLLPDWEHFPVDIDSLRWNESSQAIATPNFVAHLRETLNYHQQTIMSLSMADFQPAKFIEAHQAIVRNASDKKLDKRELLPSVEQHALLQQLVSTNKTAILVAKRGRGKSALAGFFTHHKQCWLTAPNKSSTITLQKFAKTGTLFFAPDALLIKLNESPERPEYLIIDEAAAIPIPILEQLIQQVPNVLLTTTIDGYEGTGQGVLLKLAPLIGEYALYQLDCPIRWAPHDPLEEVIDDLLVNSPRDRSVIAQSENNTLVSYQSVQQSNLMDNPTVFIAIYQLLKQAHYRTSLVDLRRVLDAQNMLIGTAVCNSDIVGAILSIQEGGLTPELSQAIWQGVRRPKGNLVAQSLVAHAGVVEAAQLRSLRINRIAVQERYRRKGIARQLIQQHIDLAKTQQRDFISVSFAYSDEIYSFWAACGFQLVHIGSHKEASSGCYAAMAIYPLTEAGNQLRQVLTDKLSRNWYWMQKLIDIQLPISITTRQEMNNDDWQELWGFAYFHRSFESSYAALCRLVNNPCGQQNDDVSPVALLIDLWINKQSNRQELIEFYQIKGKNAFIQRIRNEVKRILVEVGYNEQ